jgi:hypothetical protein
MRQRCETRGSSLQRDLIVSEFLCPASDFYCLLRVEGARNRSGRENSSFSLDSFKGLVDFCGGARNRAEFYRARRGFRVAELQ